MDSYRMDDDKTRKDINMQIIIVQCIHTAYKYVILPTDNLQFQPYLHELEDVIKKLIKVNL